MRLLPIIHDQRRNLWYYEGYTYKSRSAAFAAAKRDRAKRA